MVWEERRLFMRNFAGQRVLGGRDGGGRRQGRRQNKERKRESIGIVCILLYPEGD